MVARGHGGRPVSTNSADPPGETQVFHPESSGGAAPSMTAREAGLGLTEISMHAELTRPTTHRILSVRLRKAR